MLRAPWRTETAIYGFTFRNLVKSKPYYELQVDLPMLDFFPAWRTAQRFTYALSLNSWTLTLDYDSAFTALLDQAVKAESPNLRSVWVRENVLSLAPRDRRKRSSSNSRKLIENAYRKSLPIAFKYLKLDVSLATHVSGRVYKLEEEAFLLESSYGIKRYLYSGVYNAFKLKKEISSTDSLHNHLSLIFKPETKDKKARLSTIFGDLKDEAFLKAVEEEKVIR